jgi:3-isopropylmalate/(R)-2-methylmalate dehydratase large subunit
VPDHNVPAEGRATKIADPESRLQVETLRDNAGALGVPLIPLSDIRQGIVHVVGPEQGMMLPGTTIVCGDSHISNGRGLRVAGLRDRHERGQACAGDADPGAVPALDDVDLGGGDLPPGCEATDLILTAEGACLRGGGAVAAWRLLPSETDAVFDLGEAMDVSALAPQVSCGYLARGRRRDFGGGA